MGKVGVAVKTGLGSMASRSEVHRCSCLCILWRFVCSSPSPRRSDVVSDSTCLSGVFRCVKAMSFLTALA
jgi:hypothetical protein